MNALTVEEQKKFEIETQDFVAKANAIVIKSEMDNTQAATLTAALKAEIKRRKTILAPTKAALDASKAAYNGLVDMMITPMSGCVDIISAKIGAFVKQENAKRAELQRKEDARVAELQRKEDERIAKKQAEAEAAGKPVPVIVPKIIPQRVVAQVSAPTNTTYTTRWSAECRDIKKLCQAVADGKIETHFCLPNGPALNSMAIAIKEEKEIMPGVWAISTISTTQRN